jgi:ABC-type dipeptide/oligopeptide/nickel transport system permease component
VLAPLALLGALYGFYLLYRGIPVLMKAPDDKAMPYTAVVVVAAVVLFFVLAVITGMFMAM